MYPLMLSLVAALAFAGTGFAQTKHSAPKAPTVLRAPAPDSPPRRLPPSRSPKASIAHSANRPSAKPSTQQQVPAGRYGGFMMTPRLHRRRRSTPPARAP